MDVLSLNLKTPYTRSTNLVTNNSAVVFKNIANLIPSINTNVKRLLKVNPNVLSRRRHSAFNLPVPSIEIIPPTPGTPERKLSFVEIEINKVLSETLDLCRMKLRRFSEPCFGSNLDVSSHETAANGMGSRRSSMPCISSKYLLKVPKKSKKKRHHRRHSLPIDPENANISDFHMSVEDLRKHENLLNYKQLNKGSENVKSYEKIRYCQSSDGAPQTVHEIYISGYGKKQNDNNDVPRTASTTTSTTASTTIQDNVENVKDNDFKFSTPWNESVCELHDQRNDSKTQSNLTEESKIVAKDLNLNYVDCRDDITPFTNMKEQFDRELYSDCTNSRNSSPPIAFGTKKRRVDNNTSRITNMTELKTTGTESINQNSIHTNYDVITTTRSITNTNNTDNSHVLIKNETCLTNGSMITNTQLNPTYRDNGIVLECFTDNINNSNNNIDEYISIIKGNDLLSQSDDGFYIRNENNTKCDNVILIKEKNNKNIKQEKYKPTQQNNDEENVKCLIIYEDRNNNKEETLTDTDTTVQDCEQHNENCRFNRSELNSEEANINYETYQNKNHCSEIQKRRSGVVRKSNHKLASFTNCTSDKSPITCFNENKSKFINSKNNNTEEVNNQGEIKTMKPITNGLVNDGHISDSYNDSFNVSVDDKNTVLVTSTSDESNNTMSPTKTFSNVLNILPDVLSIKTNNDFLFNLHQTNKNILPSKVVYNVKSDDVNMVTPTSPVKVLLSAADESHLDGDVIVHDSSNEKVLQPNKKDSFDSIPEDVSDEEKETTSVLLTKASSLTGLDNFERTTTTKQRKLEHRAVSLHENSVDDPGYLESLASCEIRKPDEKPTSASMEELDDHHHNRDRTTSINKLNRQFANVMMRKAVSLYELQNERFKENVAKFEQKFLSTEVLSVRDGEDDTDQWFPRISMEDCSTCASCRSRSSSYHSLLYDIDTANRYQIYQPTVCDFIEDQSSDTTTPPTTITQTSDDDEKPTDENNSEEKQDGETADSKTKVVILKAKKDKFMKQGQATFSSFKDKWRRAKFKV